MSNTRQTRSTKFELSPLNCIQCTPFIEQSQRKRLTGIIWYSKLYYGHFWYMVIHLSLLHYFTSATNTAYCSRPLYLFLSPCARLGHTPTVQSYYIFHFSPLKIHNNRQNLILFTLSYLWLILKIRHCSFSYDVALSRSYQL